MLASPFTIGLIIYGLLSAVVAQILDVRWINPDGSDPDFTLVSTIGEPTTFSWKTLNNSKSDLYIAQWASPDKPYHRLLAAGLDISQPGTFTWKNDLGQPALSTGRQFKLVFWPLGKGYGGIETRQLLSPGFVVAGDPYASSTDSNSTSPSTSTISTTPTTASDSVTTATLSTISSTSTTTRSGESTITNTPTSSTSSTPTNTSDFSQKKQDGLSVAAQAGLGVGIAIGAIILLGAAYLFGRRSRKRLNASYVSVNSTSHLNFWPSQNREIDSAHGYKTHGYKNAVPLYTPRVELGGDRYQAQELSNFKAELAGSTPTTAR